MKVKVSRRARVVGAAVSLGFGIALCPPLAPQAQRSKETSVNVTGVSMRAKGKDAVVSISADAPLSRAQTWQDEEGFHVVVYKGQGAFKGGVPRGVRVRRIGDSLELVVPVKPGGGVYVQPRFNNLDLVVSGGLNAEAANTAAQSLRDARRSQQQQQGETTGRTSQAASQPRANITGAQSTRDKQARESIVAVTNNRTKVNLTPSLPSPAALKLPTPNGAQPPATNQTKNNVPATPQDANTAIAEPAPVEEPQAAPPAASPTEQSAPLVLAQTQDATPAGSGALKRSLIVLSICFSAGLMVFLFIFLRGRRKATTPDGEEGESRQVTKSDAIVEFEGEAQLVEQRQGERRKGLRRSDDRPTPRLRARLPRPRRALRSRSENIRLPRPVVVCLPCCSARTASIRKWRS
jgi:hypothetical protein